MFHTMFTTFLENGERGKIEDAWIMFNDLFGSELDLTIGQFQVM